MTTSWKPMSLKQAGVALIDCVHATPNPVAFGYPYIAIPQMTGGRIAFDDARQISADDFATWTRKARPRKHDIVLSRRTNPGVTAPVSDRADFALGQNLVLLRADGSHVSPEFLRWLATSTQWWAQIEKFMNVGAIFNSLRCADVPNFVLPIPPLADQRPIAAILSALDDKIELNRRMNETLEASARALFRDWFVDFGPTCAKAEGRPAYLAPDLWSLFPDRLGVDSVPEGWSVYTLGDLADQHTGSIDPAKGGDEVFEHYSLPAFDNGASPSLDRGDTIKSNKTLLPAGAVLLSKLNPEISRVWMPTLAKDAKQVASTEFLAFVPKAPAGRSLLFAMFRDAKFRQIMEGMVTGTSKSHQRISPPALRAVSALTGAPGIFDAFERVASPMMEQMLANRLASLNLAATRDALLPKLMSGEIRVRDGEALAA